MQEMQYQGNDIQNSYQAPVGGNSGGSPLVKFLLGLFTGAAVAAPVTAFITKHFCDKEKAQAVEDAENRGIQAGIQVAVQESKNMAGRAPEAVSVQIKGISEGQKSGLPEIPVYIEQNGEMQRYQPMTTGHIQKVMPNGEVHEHGVLTHEQAANVLNQTQEERDEAYLASLQAPEEDSEDNNTSGLDFDIENYNINIDDEEATEDAAEFSAQHIQYLDMVERYKNTGGEIPPMTISREQFDNEHFYQKSYVNWYPGDDVFEEENARIEDPAYLFGFASGYEMFSPERTAGREDPDICYIRHMGTSTDFEITRMSGSYQTNVADGEVYYHGDTGSFI